MAYLEQFIYELEDSYQMALVTYALTVANSNQRTNAFARLDKMKKTGWNDFDYIVLKHTFVFLTHK